MEGRRRLRSLGAALMLLGAALLVGSLFLTWSHQFSSAFLAHWGSSDMLRGVPHDPSAWQVFSVADVLLAVLAAALVLVALRGGRVGLAWAGAGVAVGLAFTLHALAVPPTNGANIFDSSIGAYTPNSPGAGPGETVAIAALVLVAAGLALAALPRPTINARRGRSTETPA